MKKTTLHIMHTCHSLLPQSSQKPALQAAELMRRSLFLLLLLSLSVCVTGEMGTCASFPFSLRASGTFQFEKNEKT